MDGCLKYKKNGADTDRISSILSSGIYSNGFFAEIRSRRFFLYTRNLVSFLIIFIIIYVKPYCKNKVKLFPSFFLVKSVFHNWHEHNYQDYPHIPSQASVLALPFPENN